MDQILAKASNQAVTFAIRSGISLASGYAIKTISKFLDKIPPQAQKRVQLAKRKIQTKIDILSISIDLVKLAAARGNTTLEATLELVNGLNQEFDLFEDTISLILEGLTASNEKESVRKLEEYMAKLLIEINDAIPLISLSLATSGINLNGNVSLDSISPGRLLQASNYLNKANHSKSRKVGPLFDLVMYSIFYNPSRMKYIESESTDELSLISWKEEFARSLVQIKSNTAFNYQLEISEDYNDGRYHEESTPRIRKYDIKTIERVFFTALGTLLRLEGRNSPVLIVKLVGDDSEEWIALGELIEGEFDDEDDLDEEEEEEVETPTIQKNTSLSLLEYLLRLSKLQQVEQKSILEVKDEVLLLYLHDQESPENSANLTLPKSIKQKQLEGKKSAETDSDLGMSSNIARIKLLDL